MKEFQVLYLPIGVPTFDLAAARSAFERSKAMLHELSDAIVVPDDMLLSIDGLKQFIETKEPDLILLQNVTFAHAAYTYEVIRWLDAPVLLWTLPEPVVDGSRLRLNSLTGAFSAGNALKDIKGHFDYVFGSPDDPDAVRSIGAAIRAAQVKHALRHLNIASVGITPQGFGFGRAMDADMVKHFGANLVSIEARELIQKAKTFTQDEYMPYIEAAKERTTGLGSIPEENLHAFARLYKAYKDFVEQQEIGALASRCWPDYFTEYGTPVCAVLSMLNDDGVASSCEDDVYGALSMYIGTMLSHKATFFGDPVSLNEEENTITYWHCGMAACSLAINDCAKVGVHPNRKIGPTMEFGCKPSGKATVFRISKKVDGGFGFYILRGKILDKPKQFCGTSIVVKTEHDAKDTITQSVTQGLEPHFVVIYGDVADELTYLANMLGMETLNH